MSLIQGKTIRGWGSAVSRKQRSPVPEGPGAGAPFPEEAAWRQGEIWLDVEDFLTRQAGPISLAKTS